MDRLLAGIDAHAGWRANSQIHPKSFTPRLRLPLATRIIVERTPKAMPGAMAGSFVCVFRKMGLAGAEGLEPTTYGFGDRHSTN
jgi:hypothetical protein